MHDSFRGTGEIKTFLVRFFSFASAYWQSEQKKTAWTLLASILVIEALRLYLTTKLSFATADVFDALDERRVDDIWITIYLWFGLLTAMLVAYIVQIHVQLTLIIHWRQFLTESALAKYLNANTYNQIQLKDYGLDNPDQRIATDLHNLADETLYLGLNFLTTIGRLIVFSVILWSVSGALEFEIYGTMIRIPGYMFWIALVYAVIGTWGAHRIAHPMTRLNFERQAAEADFRYQLVRLRENTEGIALLKGESQEKRILSQRFGVIRDNWMLLLRYQRRLIAFTMGLNQFSNLFPYMAAMPALLSGTIGLGGFLQLRAAFGRVESSLVWFASHYARLSVWKSSVDRILTLNDALLAARRDQEQSRIVWRSGSQRNFEIKNLAIELPSGETLLERVNVSLKPGQNVMITGASGSGKSTIFRALAGLWIWGEGEINLPKSGVMFLPQQPYLPNGSLRDVLVYPDSSSAGEDSRLHLAMNQCQLERFIDRLDEVTDWDRTMSGGEKQRLSIVRALFSRPDWLFLDEATSALDPVTEAAIYQVLKSELPNTTIISIAHREDLKKYHDLQLCVEPMTKSVSIHAI